MLPWQQLHPKRFGSCGRVPRNCLVLGPTDMQQLHAELQAQGIQVEETVRPAWGAQGYGQQFKLWDPDGNKIELRCYTAPPAV